MLMLLRYFHFRLPPMRVVVTQYPAMQAIISGLSQNMNFRNSRNSRVFFKICDLLNLIITKATGKS
jgi:hypothetical protein